MAERILVCDDEPHILHAVSFKLAAAGYEIVQATDGREGIRQIELAKPDLVVTDLQMPHANGFEVCEFLRSRPETANVPVILLTARALELEEEQISNRYGVTAVFMKPFSPRALLRAVQDALAGVGCQSV